jgi:hypothetical protein
MRSQNLFSQAYLSFHSYSQLILYPWGYTSSKTPDSEELYTVASIAANAIKNISQTVYKVGQTSKVLYTASGLIFLHMLILFIFMRFVQK